jgi:membrane associated rhomboid family serine protease
MTGEALLIGIATIAVVVAGFAAIAPGAAPDASNWTAGQRIRLRAIVSTSFNVTFESLLPVVLYPAIGHERTTLVIASGLVFVYVLFIVAMRLRQMIRAGGLLTPRTLVLIAGGWSAMALFGLNAVVLASLTVYALALCIQLSVAALSFYSLLADSD